MLQEHDRLFTLGGGLQFVQAVAVLLVWNAVQREPVSVGGLDRVLLCVVSIVADYLCLCEEIDIIKFIVLIRQSSSISIIPASAHRSRETFSG